MPLISLHSAHPTEWSFRQTPAGSGRWGDDRFVVGAADADALVVIDDLKASIATTVPRERRILVVTEPPVLRAYPRKFFDQFGVVLSPYALETGDAKLVLTQTGLPWFLGAKFAASGPVPILSYEDLTALVPMPKEPRISVVCSTKTNLAKHRLRLDFVEKLKAILGDRVRVFGRGFAPIDDKFDAIAPFAYHLVLENNDIGHFWTEKLADAYLGWSYPVFSGTPNAPADFPPGAMLPIDIAQSDRAIGAIAQLLDDDPYAGYLPVLREARQRLLTEHNIFAVLSRAVSCLDPAAATPPQTLYSSRPARPLKALRRKIAATLREAFSSKPAG
jgi:hypothetical protein